MGLNEDFEKCVMVHLNAVYRAAMALCGKQDVAEDMVQITFLKAYERFGSFKKGTHCRAWLLSILRNTWIDTLRQRRFGVTHVPLEDNLVAEPTTPESVWSNAEDLLQNFSDEQVIKALQQLPADQRLTLFLVDVEGLSQEEIAEITQVAVGTVKSRASRARTALKSRLAAYAKDMHFTRGES